MATTPRRSISGSSSRTRWWSSTCRGGVARDAALVRGLRMPDQLPEGSTYTRWQRLRDEWRLAVRIRRDHRTEPALEGRIISKYGPHVDLYVLRSKRAVREYLDDLDADPIVN